MTGSPLAPWQSKLRRGALWIVLLLFFFGVYRVFVVYDQIVNEPILSWSHTSRGDCAVVLTGGGGRVREGFDLLSNHQVKKLIIAGVFANSQLRDILPMWPLYGPISESDIVLERHSETTYGNAVQSLQIAEALNCRKILLVTSKLHMPRAYQTFRAIYPAQIEIYKQAVISGHIQASVDELALEIFKSLFYSLWVY